MQQRYYQRLEGLNGLRDVPADIQSVASSISSAIQAGTMPNVPAFTGNITGLPVAPEVPAIGIFLLVGGLAWIWMRSRRR